MCCVNAGEEENFGGLVLGRGVIFGEAVVGFPDFVSCDGGGWDLEEDNNHAKQIDARKKGIENRYEHQKVRAYAKEYAKKKRENRDENKR